MCESFSSPGLQKQCTRLQLEVESSRAELELARRPRGSAALLWGRSNGWTQSFSSALIRRIRSCLHARFDLRCLEVLLVVPSARSSVGVCCIGNKFTNNRRPGILFQDFRHSLLCSLWYFM